MQTPTEDHGTMVVESDDRRVFVWKTFTRKGERLVLSSEALDASTRLDAIALESVSWQDEETLADLAAAANRRERDPVGETDVEPTTDSILISNEYAEAVVETTGSNEAVELRAPKMGYSVELDAPTLEGLILQPHDRFTEFLETPFGPEGDH